MAVMLRRRLQGKSIGQREKHASNVEAGQVCFVESIVGVVWILGGSVGFRGALARMRVWSWTRTSCEILLRSSGVVSIPWLSC
jgi:hypothetical protein